MLQRVRAFFARRLLRQLIELATQTLYSEQFDMTAMVSRLSRKQGGVSLLRTYVAVQTAARLTETLSDADIERASETVNRAEAHAESATFGDILEVHKQLAELYWLTVHAAILRRKLAHKNNEHSYEGTIYILQFSNKGPISAEERAKYGPICQKMADLNRQIEAAELKAWKEQDSQEYGHYKEEIEVRNLKDEFDANEAEAMKPEFAALVAMLETKLSTLLEGGSCDQSA